MSSIPPTIPFHVARAYGVPTPPPPVAKAPQSPAPTPASNLVAARVAGGVDPKARVADDAASEPPPALPFYRHPADRHAAATEAAMGRRLDVET